MPGSTLTSFGGRRSCPKVPIISLTHIRNGFLCLVSSAGSWLRSIRLRVALSTNSFSMLRKILLRLKECTPVRHIQQSRTMSTRSGWTSHGVTISMVYTSTIYASRQIGTTIQSEPLSGFVFGSVANLQTNAGESLTRHMNQICMRLWTARQSCGINSGAGISLTL